MIVTIRHPEWLTLVENGKKILGYNQEWYPEYRQQLAGCGPTVGAMMAAYIEHKEWQIPVKSREQAVAKMLDMWKCAPPRMHGLYKSRWLRDGVREYMAARGLAGRAESLSIPSIHLLAPKFPVVKKFIAEGLAADCPVGFLNLHSGNQPIPYHWHWMALVALEEQGDGKNLCTLWDEGAAYVFDLEEWLRTTKFGGGFVRVMDTDGHRYED